MSNTKILGKNVGLYVLTGSPATYKLAVCFISTELSNKADEIDASSKCDNGYASVEQGNKKWTISGEAHAITDPSGSQVAYDTLAGFYDAGTAQDWKITDSLTSPTIYRQGSGVITEFTETFNNGETVKVKITISGRGALDFTA